MSKLSGASDINLCYSEHARRYILDTGVKPEYTYVVGSPMSLKKRLT